MAEEFQGGVCGGSWWNSSRNLFGSSPCSSAINDIGWTLSHDLLMDMNTTVSNSDSAGSNSDNSSSLVLQDVAKPQRPFDVNDQNMPSFDWNQDLLLESGRSEENYSHLLQESSAHVLNPSMNYRPQIKDWSSNNFCDNNSFKQVNQDFPIEQFTPITTQGQSSGFPLNSAPFSYTSLPLLQSLFEDDTLQSMNYSPAPRMMNSNDFAKSIRPSMAKQQPADPLQFSNNTPYWNSKAAAFNNLRPSFPPSTQPQFIPSSVNNAKPNVPNFAAKHHIDETGNVASVAKKASCETPFKRPRIETPSPLPTFKVRKEKLGDRITALQQLVSPFGKTDTASVLHEAIEYIKFLHDQVNVLSTPYMKNGSPPLQHQQAIDKLNDQEGQKQDLKSRGLCLVPISSTFPVASETTSDFWTPTFGGSFR